MVAVTKPSGPTPIDAEWLRQLTLELGADDVGFVSIDRPELADQRADIEAVFPGARALVSFVCRMNREPIRTPARSLSNLEFHRVNEDTDEVGHRLVRALEAEGIRALNPSVGFPMEQDRWPGKIWVISHKPVAVAAGLGRMGIHRNVIHPKFGNFVLLGTVIVGQPISAETEPIAYNPCFECKLCVAACPTGAIKPDGRFDFAACYTHNYREFLGGFEEWVGRIADAKSAKDYRRRTRSEETVSMWQSLSYKPNYKAAYCMAVCPAGEDVIGPFQESRKDFVKAMLKPLQKKVEPVYVIRGSDAQAHVEKRFPHKEVRLVGSSLRPNSINSFLSSANLAFQPGVAKDMEATFHFRFSGASDREATFRIEKGSLFISDGLVGEADLTVSVDADTWLGIVKGERNPVWAVVRRKLRVKGPISLLQDFQRCFPG